MDKAVSALLREYIIRPCGLTTVIIISILVVLIVVVINTKSGNVLLWSVNALK